MQIYSKNNKNCFFLISWPIFILFVLSDRARWRLQNLYTKFWNSLIMLIYANLRSPGRVPGVQSAIIIIFSLFFIFIFFYYYYYFFFFYLFFYFFLLLLLLLFFFFFFFYYAYFFLSFHVPSGASNFYFLTSRKLYHMKFVIFDVARCRMSATSLTFWL